MVLLAAERFDDPQPCNPMPPDRATPLEQLFVSCLKSFEHLLYLRTHVRSNV
jgi:hypothetical protein